MATELKIIDGILLDCQTDAKTVRIPKEVKYVSKHAFDSCENVNIINLYPDYVNDKLAETIHLSQKRILMDYEPQKRYSLYEEYEPTLPVWDADSEQIENAINKALAIQKVEVPDIEWRTMIIDADEIGEMTDTMRQAGRENLLSKDGNIYSTMYDLPLIPYFAFQYVSNATEVNEWIERHGFGILYIKGINKENYTTLGHNFDYSMIRHHTFGIGRISPRWLIVIGTEVRLDSSDWFALFSGAQSCCMKGPKEYLEYMASIGRLIE